MEHVVLSHVVKHLSSNKISINEQHGFHDHLSTVTQLITSVNDWTETINRKGQTDVILLDFSKAFDKVSHQHLSTKLEYYGIRNSTLAWINSSSQTESKLSQLTALIPTGLMSLQVSHKGRSLDRSYFYYTSMI